MGKKKKVLNSDPILQKDYKYERRKKMRAEQREIQLEKAKKQEQQKQRLMRIQQEVDQEIKSSLIKFSKTKPIKKFSQKMLKLNPQAKNKKPSTMQKLRLQLKKPQDVDNYRLHFSEIPNTITILKEERKDEKQILNEQVKAEMENMFKMEDPNLSLPNQEKDKIDEEETAYKIPYILKKKQQEHEYQIRQNNYQLSAQAKQNTFVEEQLAHKTLLKSYSDYIFIENKQEQTIQEFRSQVLAHIVQHLARCQIEEKAEGFVNGKVLIICPYVGDAKAIIDLLEYSYEGFKKLNKQKLEEQEDDNDFFKMGININEKKKVIEYFPSFNRSQVIIGSAVGLKAILCGEEEEKSDSSFLSSIEILYIDRASTIVMQNWDHLISVIDRTNEMPKTTINSIDQFRPALIEQKAKLYRQTIVFTEYNFPQLNGLKHQHCHNWQGSVTNQVLYPRPTLIENESLEQNFHKISITQPKDDLRLRLQFFKRKFWDQLHNNDNIKNVVLLVRSYFQFIQLKQFLTKVNASADFISQHTKKNKVQSKVARFNNRQYRILLLSERAYYFDVCQISKVSHVLFYSLPYNYFVYYNIVNSIKPLNYMKNRIITLYSNFDALALERVVGTNKAMEMLKSYCTNVSFIV